MKPCPEHKRELAACASGAQPPSADLAGHLRQCACCRTAFAQLEAVAALQIRAAAKLPSPTLRPQLAARFAKTLPHPSRKSVVNRGFPIFRLQTRVLCGAALLAGVLLGLFFVPRKFENRQPPGPSIADASPTHVKNTANAPAPTWQALRNQLHRDDPALGDDYPRLGAVVSQYRLKDAYFEAN
jgi:hypothetical protein